jgi:c-di-GMP-binding flagellar brake protein YcgR
MGEKEHFQVKQKIEIARLDEDKYYNAFVWDVLPETIHITLPLLNRKYFLPEEGSMIKGRFAQGDGLYSFEANVCARIKSDSAPLIILRKPDRLFRRQRREYFRYPIGMEMEYKSLGEGGNIGKLSKEQWSRALILDLSGGGIKFAAREKFDQGISLRVRLYLGGEKGSTADVIETVGRVVWAVKGQIHTYGLQFTAIKEPMRDKIISFIFTLPRGKAR